MPSENRTATDLDLVVEGGRAVRTTPFAPWPNFERDEIEAATRVLQSGKVNYWTGEEGRRFEEEFAAQAGCKYGIAVANGTVALELALQVLGVGPGAEVIVPSRTFIASASCAVMRGAIPVIADIDYESQNISAQTIKPLITPRTKAIIAVHLAGWPCEMDEILDLAKVHKLHVIEDCAQAHGATYRSKPVGSFGHIAAFSFCQDKIMTTGGEGGMFLTDDRDAWDRAWSFKDHGKSYDAVHRKHPPGFRWLHKSFGTNWRLTEMQSALGRIQLRKLPQWTKARQKNAALLTAAFSAQPALRVARTPPHIGHSFYKYYCFLRPERLRPEWNRDRVMEGINAEGVPCFSGSCGEIYREEAFPVSMRPSRRHPVARELAESSLVFLVHPTLSETDMMDTSRAVEKVLNLASR